MAAPAIPAKKDINVKFIIEGNIFKAKSKDNNNPDVIGIVTAAIPTPAKVSSSILATSSFNTK